MKTHIVLTSFFAGILMAGCSSAPSETPSSALQDLGRGAGHSLPDGAAGGSSQGKGDDPSSGHGNGGGQGPGGGQGVGDVKSDSDAGHGMDCKPLDGGPSPCGQAEGHEDTDGAHPEDTDAADKGNGNGDGIGGGHECKPLDGGPSPCARREGLEDHSPHAVQNPHDHDH
jgi:hypothetical protein